MKCEKCGSENVNVQIVNETSFKQNHGCLFTILFGWIYWAWLVVKWMFKYSVYICYWICWGWISLIICSSKKKSYHQPEWLKKMMQKHGKTYNKQESIVVCQDCGFRKKVKQ